MHWLTFYPQLDAFFVFHVVSNGRFLISQVPVLLVNVELEQYLPSKPKHHSVNGVVA